MGIELEPKKYRFYLPLTVRFADTDLQGHVFFSNYFTYCDEGFMAFLDRTGFSWQRLERMGVELYYVGSSCQFRGRAFFGETLHVHTGIGRMGKSSMTAEMTIIKPDSDKVIAVGKIDAVMVSRETEKSTPLPEEFRRTVQDFQR